LPYIIQFSDGFQIGKEVLEQMRTDYELEAFTLSMMLNQSFGPENHYFHDIIDSFKAPSTSETENELLEMLIKVRPLELDDILFRVDHHILYNKLRQLSIDTIANDPFLYELLTFVSYFAPPTDRDHLKSIDITRLIRQFSNSIHPSEIVTDLSNKNQIPLALLYLSNQVKPSLFSAPLCQLFSLNLNKPENISAILQFFPERYDIIASHFFYVPGILSQLLAFSPPERFSYFKGLSLLPPEICADSNLFETATIISAYHDNPHCIYNLTEELAVIFNDKQLVQILEPLNDGSPKWQSVCAHIYPFFKDIQVFIHFWTQTVINRLIGLNVNSIPKERELLIYFRGLRFVLKLATGKFIEQLKIVDKIVSQQPFARINISYTLGDFRNPSAFGLTLLQIVDCLELDETLISEIGDLFECPIANFYLNRIFRQLLIGSLGLACQTIQKYNLKLDVIPCCYYDSTYPLLSPFTRFPLFDHHRLKSISLSEPHQLSLNEFNLCKRFQKLLKFHPPTSHEIEPKLTKLIHSFHNLK
jgi:hypothetical protein